MIATARHYNESNLKILSQMKKTFYLQRHGNAVKPTSAVYYRTDSKVLCTSRKEITKNKNYDDIYKTVNTTNDFSVGTEIRNPKQLYNIKQPRGLTWHIYRQGSAEYFLGFEFRKFAFFFGYCSQLLYFWGLVVKCFIFLTIFLGPVLCTWYFSSHGSPLLFLLCLTYDK